MKNLGIISILLSLLILLGFAFAPKTALTESVQDARVSIKNTSIQERIYDIYWIDHPAVGKHPSPYLMAHGKIDVNESFTLNLSYGLYFVEWRQNSFPPLPPEEKLVDIIIIFKLRVGEDAIITCDNIIKMSRI